MRVGAGTGDAALRTSAWGCACESDLSRARQTAGVPGCHFGSAAYASVFMGPQHPEYVRFQPGPAIAMSFDDLKVIEAHLFLQSVVDGRRREPGVREILRAAMVIDAMARSVESGHWEEVRSL